MEASALTPKLAAMPIDLLVRSKELSESEKIAGVSRHFEAILLRQFLSEAQKPVFEAKSAMAESTKEIYRDMMGSVLADEMSKAGSFGLAKQFQAQLAPLHHSPTASSLPDGSQAQVEGAAEASNRRIGPRR